MSKQTLGRGFDSLIPQNFELDTVATPGEHVKQMSIDSIVVNPDQPRKEFDEGALKELAQSIKQHGIIQPLVVTPFKDKFRIVAGERRYRASKIAGLKKLPVIVRNHEELEELEIALVENVQRVDLSPLEQAVSIVRLRDQFSLTPKQIAAKLGKAETTISNIVRLLQLPPEAVEAMQKNRITEGHARAILALKTDEEAQKDLLNKIIIQKLSVREAESYVNQKKYSKDSKSKLSEASNKLINTLEPENRKRVKINEKTEKSGQVTIKYSSIEQLRKILQNL